MGTITYYYRGGVERGDGKGGYRWHEGYSENSSQGGILYPWMTQKECRAEAAKRNAQAVFENNKGKEQTK